MRQSFLSWTHYLVLLQVFSKEARDWYEKEYYIHRVSEADMQASQTLNNVFKTSFENQTKGKEEIEIEEYKRSLEKMKQLGFKTLKEYFEYLNYMKSKGFNIPL